MEIVDMHTDQERIEVFLLSSNMNLSNQAYCVVLKRYVNNSLTS